MYDLMGDSERPPEASRWRLPFFALLAVFIITFSVMLASLLGALPGANHSQPRASATPIPTSAPLPSPTPPVLSLPPRFSGSYQLIGAEKGMEPFNYTGSFSFDEALFGDALGSFFFNYTTEEQGTGLQYLLVATELFMRIKGDHEWVCGSLEGDFNVRSAF
jgi:hypothetical protein